MRSCAPVCSVLVRRTVRDSAPLGLYLQSTCPCCVYVCIGKHDDCDLTQLAARLKRSAYCLNLELRRREDGRCGGGEPPFLYVCLVMG